MITAQIYVHSHVDENVNITIQLRRLFSAAIVLTKENGIQEGKYESLQRPDNSFFSFQ